MKLKFFMVFALLYQFYFIMWSTAQNEVEFSSSNLPLVIITTENSIDIPDEPKISAFMQIISNSDGRNKINDSANVYTGMVAIEIRGNTSAKYPQKPYAFETRNDDGSNNNVALLGMPKENDWVLFSNYNDKVFMRNGLAYELFRKMGHWAANVKLCEVILNGSYQGVYSLSEYIKRDANRVDIATLKSDENSGDDLTGGYIFKVDPASNDECWTSDYLPYDNDRHPLKFAYHYPKAEDISIEQKQYIKAYVDEFQETLYGDNFKDVDDGYRKYLDVNSFIDYWIVSEVSRNVDAFKKSRYFYKDKDSNDKKIYSGPVWDFDWAWKKRANCLTDGYGGDGWMHLTNECNVNPPTTGWSLRLLEDQAFVDELNKRYMNLRENLLSEDYLFSYIDSINSRVYEAQTRHFEAWDILGKQAGAKVVGRIPETFDEEISEFKDWINHRLNWLDINIPAKYPPSISSMSPYKVSIKVYFTHGDRKLNISASKPFLAIEWYTVSGSKVLHVQGQNRQTLLVDTDHLQQGIYILKVHFVDGSSKAIKVIKRF